MFGKPQWFRDKKIGWGLVPITWQGWAYTGIWSLVIAIPFLVMVLAFSNRIPEAIIWLGASIVALVFDVRKIKKAKRDEERSKLMFIGDDEGDAHVATRNYDLHVRE